MTTFERIHLRVAKSAIMDFPYSDGIIILILNKNEKSYSIQNFFSNDI